MKKYIIFLALLVPIVAMASVSIGLSAPRLFDLGTVHPNRVYDVGKVTVVNTGDAYGCFKMNVSYLQDQEGLRTPADWILYTPSNFCLEPKTTQVVDIKLYPHKPFKRGRYFNYLEACTDFGNNVGACVATKLYFSLNMK